MCLVSGDNANTLKDMPTKGGREEKEQVSATTTTVATPTTSLAVVDSSDNEVVTENLWKEEKLANDDESEAGQQSTIRNTSDARGIFSNMVKTINKCKCPTLIEFFGEFNCNYPATLLLTIRGERKENHWWEPCLRDEGENKKGKASKQIGNYNELTENFVMLTGFFFRSMILGRNGSENKSS